MFLFKLAVLALISALVLVQLALVQAGDKQDTFIIGGQHGCGPKLLLKTGSKKKGDILVMNDCKKEKHKQTHYIPYPVYHSYGGYGGHDSGYGHDSYGHDEGHY